MATSYTLNGETIATPYFVTTEQRVDTLDEQAMAAVLNPAVQIGDFAPCEIQHSLRDLDSLTDDQLARWKIARVMTPDAPPPPVRPELDKGVIESRLDAIGKLGDAFAALQANPLMFGQWFRQSWPNVYKDDPALLQMLQQIGLTPEQIATVTA